MLESFTSTQNIKEALNKYVSILATYDKKADISNLDVIELISEAKLQRTFYHENIHNSETISKIKQENRRMSFVVMCGYQMKKKPYMWDNAYLENMQKVKINICALCAHTKIVTHLWGPCINTLILSYFKTFSDSSPEW